MTFVRFGLIVTGRGEAEFLPRFFRALMGSANCTFQVIRKSEQLNPITSQRRILNMTGRGRRLPTIDEEQFGLPALGFLRQYQNSYVLVIDDLEGSRRQLAGAVFARYRTGLNSVLGSLGLSNRAAVHFLVNMLEAYYFADHEAVNAVAGKAILREAYIDDVETIPHPKNALKGQWHGFDEIEHGKEIVDRLHLETVLDRPNECCWLRNMFAWCVDRLVGNNCDWDDNLQQRFQLPSGMRAIVTGGQ